MLNSEPKLDDGGRGARWTELLAGLGLAKQAGWSNCTETSRYLDRLDTSEQHRVDQREDRSGVVMVSSDELMMTR